MSYLVRKITPSLWPDWVYTIISCVDDLSGDAITLDLKTSTNTLSLWEIQTLDELLDISVAIATTRNEAVDFLVVAIPKELLESKIKLSNTQNNDTAFVKYREHHYDLLDIKLRDIKIFAEIVAETLKDKAKTKTFVFNANKQYIKQLIDDGMFDIDFLKTKGRLYKFIMDY